jgi:hypothetical protein
MKGESSNRDRLREAGLIADAPLRDEHYDFIDELSDEEINVLLDLKRRLEERGIETIPLTGKATAMPVL